ncbi:MAG: nodulation protein NfeD [Vicinamibacterales bacterium]
MERRDRRRAAARAWPLALLGVALGVWVAGAAGRSALGAEDPPLALVAEYDGIIHPIAAEFVDDAVAGADRANAAVLILVLRTPGGLLDATRTIVSRMIAARTPVVVFVAPGGARAASAGFLITLAADVAAMAPGTHIGAAHPVSASGQAPAAADDPTSEKATADAAAYARSLAEARGRNTTLAAEAVTESRAFTDREALTAEPPLIDLTATDVTQLLERLDGRTVRRFDGRTTTLVTAGARVEHLSPTWRQSVLGALAHPQVAYLLFTLGMLGLVVELWNPGFVFPGVAGGVSLLLAFFAFQVVPVNVAGLLLLALGLALLGAELMVPSFGVLGVGGIVALLIGSLMVTREVPGVAVPYTVIGAVVVAAAAVMLGLGRLAIRAQRRPAATGVATMVGQLGTAVSAIGAEPGQIAIHGELWRAVSAVPIATGTVVQVIGVDGLTLRVQPQATDPSPGGAP